IQLISATESPKLWWAGILSHWILVTSVKRNAYERVQVAHRGRSYRDLCEEVRLLKEEIAFLTSGNQAHDNG
ncbi:MAG: hypothetical protein ACYS72_02610, partial [Planctomycetota bacterium]